MHALVVGSGIAGLTAALHAHERGHTVTLVTKGLLGDGCTGYAQGGVAGVYGPGDSAAAHAADTMTAGAGLCDPAAVDVLVADGAARIAELVARGVAFDRGADGRMLLGREAAHRSARIVHAGGDATGAAISLALCAAMRRTTIAVIERALLTDIVVADGRVRGIRLLRDDAEGTAPAELAGDAVIIATGGAGQLYAHTTNPSDITGDGVAAAVRAGAAAIDLEFVQFHPTILAAGAPFLISEAVRGEGATLIDSDGTRFVADAHPDGELAPRDVVARAIARRAAAQGAPVRLDATALGAAALARRFPTIDRVTRERGFDWSREPLPVTPAAHYLMGGIATDLDGRTRVPGLFAIGEAARTGVHGANRLASNSLLEGAVFAARAAAALDPTALAPLPAPRPEGMRRPADVATRQLRRDALGRSDGFDRAALQQLMWDHVGLLRTGDGLRHALATIRGWRSSAATPTGRAQWEDANLLLLAEQTAAAALRRTVSVGSHHRLDRLPAPVRTTPAAPILENA